MRAPVGEADGKDAVDRARRHLLLHQLAIGLDSGTSLPVKRLSHHEVENRRYKPRTAFGEENHERHT